MVRVLPSMAGSMRRLALTAATAFAAIGGPAPALAQLTQASIVTNALAIPEQLRTLNIEEIIADGYIPLEWSATVNPFQAYDYQMSYEKVITVETTTVTFLHLDRVTGSPEATGDVVSGRKYIINIRPSQIIRELPSDVEKLPGGSATVDNGSRNIKLRVFPSGAEANVNIDAIANWEFKYDTRRPPAPTIIGASIGEAHVRVTWAPPSSDSDVETYQVVYCPSAGETETSTAALPCDDPRVQTGIAKTQDFYDVEDELQNDVRAAFAVRSVDLAGNIGELSNVFYQTPKEVSDYFELYRDRGGDEEGGFCFIATAATGSYAHPVVQVLRAFRDYVLKQTPLGTFGVWSYYHLSPPLAAQVAHHPELAGAVRVALIPVALMALMLLFAPLFGAGVIVWRLASRKRALLVASTSVALVLIFAQPARAEEQLSRPKSSLRGFGLGLFFKGGPYLPALAAQELPGDVAPNGSPQLTSFAAVFAEERDDSGNVIRPVDENALYTVGVDLQLFRDFGTAGIGGTFGFMQFVGRAYFPDSGAVTQDTTVFNLMPLTLTAFYRFDYLADRTAIPFVPYARGGLAYDIWWITNGRGHVSRWRGDDTSSLADDKQGKGGKFGLSATFGMAILLNVFERSASRGLFESTSIRGTYFFVEYQIDKVNGFPSKGFDLSDNTWNMGVYVEL